MRETAEESLRETAEEFGGQPINYKSIIKPVLQYELYNPSDKPQHFSKAGVDFYLPARDKRWRGKDPTSGQQFTYPKPGVLPIWGIPEQRITALQVVQFAVGEDGISGVVGINGVRALFDEEEQNKPVYSEARRACLRKEVADANLTVQNHERAVAKAKAADEQPPVPGRIVQEAYNFLARAGADADEFLPIRCSTCNWGFPDDTRMWEHVLSMHRERRAEAEKALMLEGKSAAVVTGEKAYEAPPDAVLTPPTKEELEETARLMNSGHSDDPRLVGGRTSVDTGGSGKAKKP